MMLMLVVFVFFFKQKTAYEMRISDWSSDVCSSDLDGVDLALRDLERNGRIELLKLVICGRVAHQLLYKHMLYFGGIGTRINFSDQLDNDIIPNRGSAARINIDQIASPIARLHRFAGARKSVGSGKRVSGRGEIGGRRKNKKK